MRINSTILLAAALAAAASAAAFPMAIEVNNNDWAPRLEPETGTGLEGGETKQVTVRDADQLTRVVCNVENLNLLNGRADDGGLAVILPFGPEVAEAMAKAEAEAKAEADKAAKAAAKASKSGGGAGPTQ